MKGRELKQLIENHIQDEDIVCIGEKDDNLGQYDKKNHRNRNKKGWF